MQGYFDGAGRAHRAESEQRRLERVIEIARDHEPQLIDGIMEIDNVTCPNCGSEMEPISYGWFHCLTCCGNGDCAQK